MNGYLNCHQEKSCEDQEYGRSLVSNRPSDRQSAAEEAGLRIERVASRAHALADRMEAKLHPVMLSIPTRDEKKPEVAGIRRSAPPIFEHFHTNMDSFEYALSRMEEMLERTDL